MTDPRHPLEDVFDLNAANTTSPFAEPETALSTDRAALLTDPTTGEVIPRVVDADLPALNREERLEDMHIDGQLDSIHRHAVDAFEKQSRMSEEVDPRFAARNAEVAAQYLNIALNAVNSRVDAKFKRQKVRIAQAQVVKPGTPSTINQTVIVADRNKLLERILGGEVIDVETIQGEVEE